MIPTTSRPISRRSPVPAQDPMAVRFTSTDLPVAAFPRGLQHFAHVLPSNRYAELGWKAAAGALPTTPGLALLVGWTVLFGVLAAAAYRRSTATR